MDCADKLRVVAHRHFNAVAEDSLRTQFGGNGLRNGIVRVELGKVGDEAVLAVREAGRVDCGGCVVDAHGIRRALHDDH